MADQTPGEPDAPQDPLAGSDGIFGWSVEHPTPAAEHTQPLPPFQHAPSATTSAPVRRTGSITAAVLAGSLLLGGAAGVGGAAWYDAWKGKDNDPVSAVSPAATNATNAADLPAGSAERVAAEVLPSVVKINVNGSSGSGSGSGIILTSDGEILTNNHVVQLAGSGGTISVNFNDGKTVKATVVGTDPVTDIAVIKAQGVSGLSKAHLGSSSSLRVGQPVVAMGSPYGLNATVTTGIVSALNRPVSVASEDQQQQTDPFGFGLGQQQTQPNLSTTYPAIQTDAAINPGNSGGPLVDMAGHVVGINSSIRTASDSSSQGGSIGLGFSIPIDEVLPVIQQIITGQTPTHARLAISVTDLSTDTLAQGALIKQVAAGGAAQQAGLKPGDVITKVGDDLIDGSESLVATIRGHRPGEKVTITYLRGGSTRTTSATLGSDAQTTQS